MTRVAAGAEETRARPTLPPAVESAHSPARRLNELFAGLRSNRDRAILALGISNGARASELLGVRGADLDWGEQLVRVSRKGTGAEQWLPGGRLHSVRGPGKRAGSNPGTVPRAYSAPDTCPNRRMAWRSPRSGH